MDEDRTYADSFDGKLKKGRTVVAGVTQSHI